MRYVEDGRSPPAAATHASRHARSASSVTSPTPHAVSHLRSGSTSGTLATSGKQYGAFTGWNNLNKSKTLPASLHVRSGSSPVSPHGSNPASFSPYNARAEIASPGSSNGFGVGYISQGSRSTVPQNMARPAQTTHRNLPTSSRYPAAKSGYL